MAKMFKYIFGGVLGAGLAMLLTPKKGSEMRRMLMGKQQAALPSPEDQAPAAAPVQEAVNLDARIEETRRKLEEELTEPFAGVEEAAPPAPAAEPEIAEPAPRAEPEMATAEPVEAVEPEVVEPPAPEPVEPEVSVPETVEPAEAEGLSWEDEEEESWTEPEKATPASTPTASDEAGMEEGSAVSYPTAPAAEPEMPVEAPEPVEAPVAGVEEIEEPYAVEEPVSEPVAEVEETYTEIEEPFVEPEEPYAVEEPVSEPYVETVEEIAEEPAVEPVAEESEVAMEAAEEEDISYLATPAEGEPEVTETKSPPSEEAPPADEEGGRAGFDREAMRRRIEETRARLKAKAFDAMVQGESFVTTEEEEDDAGPQPEIDSASDNIIEQSLREDD